MTKSEFIEKWSGGHGLRTLFTRDLNSVIECENRVEEEGEWSPWERTMELRHKRGLAGTLYLQQKWVRCLESRDMFDKPSTQEKWEDVPCE